MAAGVGSSSGSMAGERTGGSRGGIGTEGNRGTAGGFGGIGGNKPAGPGWSPKFDSFMPNGIPPQGLFGGVAMLADAIANGNVNPYGKPQGWADQRSRDLGGIGRGNAGGGDNRFGGSMPGGGMRVGGQLHPAALQHLAGMSPAMRAFFASRGMGGIPAPAAAKPAPAVKPAPAMAQAPGMFMQSGLPGYGTFRPGYSFMGPGGA